MFALASFDYIVIHHYEHVRRLLTVLCDSGIARNRYWLCITHIE